MDRNLRTAAGAALIGALLVLAGCAGSDTGGSPGTGGSATPDPAGPTDQVDIGGRSLHYACEGTPVEGEPPILLLSGGNLGVGSWYPMITDLADRGHLVCGFDRAGFGGSDPAPQSRRTSSDTVADVLAGVEALDLATPLVLVAHSAGALEAAVLSSKEPTLVSGVVLVDPLGPHVDDALRAALPPRKPGEPAALADEREFLTVLSRAPGRNPEHLDLAASEHEAAVALDGPGPLWGEVPVVVLQAPLPGVAGLPADYVATFGAAVDADLQEYAAESTHGRLVRLEHTGHLVMVDRPQAVIAAVENVLDR